MILQLIDRYRLTVDALERHLRAKHPGVRCTIREQDDDTYAVQLPLRLSDDEIEQLRTPRR
ncbi:hypothetical protein VPNG_01206 [Cytospora leucostoma]|uniref:Uncharacterized protein n=1 Tax=Cytospora leucostoma TaxID=1230097 RepID=A0A423XL55_9PEZI|nr:hypothetical protein VPNG_01206 [Cytospora leucostoma]